MDLTDFTSWRRVVSSGSTDKTIGSPPAALTSDTAQEVSNSSPVFPAPAHPAITILGRSTMLCRG